MAEIEFLSSIRLKVVIKMEYTAITGGWCLPYSLSRVSREFPSQFPSEFNFDLFQRQSSLGYYKRITGAFRGEIASIIFDSPRKDGDWEDRQVEFILTMNFDNFCLAFSPLNL